MYPRNRVRTNDWMTVILASIFLSFGITMPIGMILLIFVIMKQIKKSDIMHYKINTDFSN